MGSIEEIKMYPLDFEEFLLANGVGNNIIIEMKKKFELNEHLEISIHNKIMELFKLYLIVGGLPDPLKSYIQTKNIFKVRQEHDQIYNFYSADASKYDLANKLKIKTIYDYMAAKNENSVKKIQFTKLSRKNARFEKYQDF